MTDFVNLHLHSHYSLYDGAMSPKDIAFECEREGHTACALTDHGVVYGYRKFHNTMLDHGIKPIPGIEFYLAYGKGYGHITVLAMDDPGYRNLLSLHNLSFTRPRFYYKPRIFINDLARYSDGLIATSGCLGSIPSKLFAKGKVREARLVIDRLARIFPGRFFLEMQPHRIPEQQALNAFLADEHYRTGLPLLAAADAHHACNGRDIYEAVMMTNSKYDLIDLPFGTCKNMATLPLAARANSLEIADVCTPPNLKPEQSFFPVIQKDVIDRMLEYVRNQDVDKKQLEYEIQIISDLGFLPYFAVIWDVRQWSDKEGILWGPGRGSAAGSVFAYALGITDIDPVHHGLYFERFLNPERVSLPDIDIDIQSSRRQDVLDYIAKKYGAVYKIATFKNASFKIAIKDVAKALGYEPQEGLAFSKTLPNSIRGEAPSSAACIDAMYAGGVPEDVIEQTIKLADRPHSLSRHAGGIVIVPSHAPTPPLFKMSSEGGKVWHDVYAGDMHDVEEAGLVKYDFLGLIQLDIIDHFRRKYKYTPDPYKDWSEDIEKMLWSGELFGIFQLEAHGISEFTTRYKPRSIEDISAISALYRPGPLDSGIADRIIEIRNGKAQADGPLFIYQEQIMQYARDEAGYSLAEADKLRKAIGKKDPKALAKHANAFDPEVWKLIQAFGSYAFNKCLTGDTVIERAAANKHTSKFATIKELYEQQEYGGKSIKEKMRRQGLQILQYDDDGRIRPGKLKKLYYQGKQHVWKVTTESGKTLTGTANHRLLTSSGYLQIDELTTDTLLVCKNPHRGYQLPKGYSSQLERVVSVEYVGIEDTYDIEMETSGHNFMANDIVSHNSHSMAYSYVSFETLYWKSKHTLEYLTQYLNCRSDKPEAKIPCLLEIKHNGYEILPPQGLHHWQSEAIDSNTMQLGMTVLKGCKTYPKKGKLNKTHLKAIEAINSGDWKKELAVAGIPLKYIDWKRNYGLVCHVYDGNSQKTGKKYHRATLEVAGGWSQKFCRVKPQVGSLVVHKHK